MGLFDDDFYSPKVSPWEKRRLQNGEERWPRKRRFGRRTAFAVLAGVLGVALFVLLIPPLWGASGSGGAKPSVAAGRTGNPVDVSEVVERLEPAIVSVVNLQTFVFGDEEETSQEAAVGSGIVYRIDGNKAYIVTNYHVIDSATALEVVLSDGKRLDAELIGADMLTDLAVLRTDAGSVKGVAEFGNSDTLKKGEWAIAFGHPFGLGYSPTPTIGIISSLQRTIPISLAMDGTIDWEMDMLQTDAAINQGNSGGALVNLRGQVVGINSMKVAQVGAEGLGFAIPSNTAGPIIAELEQYGKMRRPYLGVASVDLSAYETSEDSDDVLRLPDDVTEGIIVLETYGPSSEAGLRTNDVIVALDGKPIDSTLALRKYLYGNKKIGDPIRVDFYRGSERDSVTVKLIETPDPEE